MTKLDPRKLKPSVLTRMLNSTPLGEVISERQLRRHRNRAGYRIGDDKRVDLLRYVAWLVEQRHAPKPDHDGPRGYEAMKERARARNAELSAAGRDIGELPEVVDPDRKARCKSSFRGFCETYFPQTFNLPWSNDHLKVIAKIEQAVLHGGLFAMAMPRGSGKTSLCECACIWAILIGAREFVCLIGSDEDHAASMLDSIKTEFECNELLLEDYPEAVYPVHCLEGIHNRAKGQTFREQRTRIGWTADHIVLPTIPDSACSGAIIRVAGLTGRIRGMKYKRPNGEAIRPSLVFLDDPQTDQSARSPSQCAVRERILAGAILGLAGPGRKIAGLLTGTIVRDGDMVHRILDRDEHPQWQGERTKMVYVFPANEKLWTQYAELRADSLRNDGDGHEATEFYDQHREAMDEGAVIAWPARHNADELSAVQHAMNLKLQDEGAFFAEYQNEPLPEDEPDEDLLTADEIAAKINNLPRELIPIGCNHVTMFIDVQGKMLFYVVAAWEDDFTGYVVDYGSFPDQKREYYTLRDARRTLTGVTGNTGLEAAIYAGLETLTNDYLSREWKRDDGAMVRIDRCMIDANWGNSTDVVYQFCRQSSHASILLPSHGRYVGASSIPFSEYKKKRGERVGHYWRIPNVKGKRAVRHVVFDTNYWKSFCQTRLASPMGDPGCLSLFGSKPERHRLLADHLTAEFRVRTEGRGRSVDEWKLRPEVVDNHWLDCLVGCAVAASIQGAVLFGTQTVVKTARPALKLSALREARR